MSGRRISRAQKRAAYWRGRIRSAPDGDGAMSAALDWIRSELAHMREVRPADAELTQRNLADQWGDIAERLPAHKPKRVPRP